MASPPPPPRKAKRLPDHNAHNPLLSLPRDVLQLILARLDLLSHVRLGAACRFLKLLAITDNPPHSKPLWRIGSTEPDKLLCRFFTNPINYKLRRPRVQARLPLRFLGCHEGWFVMEEGDSPRRTIYAYNRILGSRINFPRRERLRHVWKVVLSSDPRSRHCVVAAMHDFNRVSIIRPHSERSWTTLSHGDERRCALDVVFYQQHDNSNGSCSTCRNNLWLWVIFADGFYGIDLNSFPLVLQRLSMDFPTRSPPDFSSMIVFGSKLLLTTVCMDPQERNFDLSFEGCLWELDTATMEFVKADGFQDGALLLGTSHSGYVPSSERQTLKGGGIYMGAKVSWALERRMRKRQENNITTGTNASEEEEDEDSKCLHWKIFP